MRGFGIRVLSFSFFLLLCLRDILVPIFKWIGLIKHSEKMEIGKNKLTIRILVTLPFPEIWLNYIKNNACEQFKGVARIYHTLVLTACVVSGVQVCKPNKFSRISPKIMNLRLPCHVLLADDNIM